MSTGDFLMPSLGADMEAGKVVEWHVHDGDRVRSGDVVCVVETHKGAIDVECFLDGVISDLAPLGKDMLVGALLAHVSAEGRPAVQSSAPAAAPPARQTAPAATAAPVPPPTMPPMSRPATTAATTGGRVKASPAARRLAGELGVALEGLVGHGVDGGLTMADVQAAAHGSGTPAPAPAPSGIPARAAAAARGFDPAQMRQAIGAAMARAKREIPHYYLASTVDFGAAAAWVEHYNADRDPAERLLPAVLLLKAAARGLAEVPQLNGSWVDDAFQPGPGVHLGWAVSLRGGGLIAPAIHHADRQPLPALMTALRDLVQRARSGGLRSSEMSDATATVTSLGDRGADSVYGVIVPPQVALIGFGRVLQRPWVVDGQVVARPLVELSLAADHRASDGHLGGRLLAAIDAALQDPEKLDN